MTPETRGEVEAALKEILDWDEFQRSPQLARFLEYVVNTTLDGKAETIKAYAIAVDVFGRGENFDSQADPIVRVQARRLRDLIDRFYRSGNASAGIEIRIPVGGYVPRFIAVGSDNDPAASASPPAPANPDLPVRQGWSDRAMGRTWLLPIVALSVAVGAIAAGLFLEWQGGGRGQAAPLPSVVIVSTLEDLSSTGRLASTTQGLATEIASRLSRFGLYDVVQASSADEVATAPGHPVFVLSGVASDTADGVAITLSIISQDRGQVVWTGNYQGLGLRGTGQTIGEVAEQVATATGGAYGPFLEAGRAWIEEEGSKAVDAPSDYVCRLLFQRFAFNADPAYAGYTQDCYDRLAEHEPPDATAQSVTALLEAWAVLWQSAPERIGFLEVQPAFERVQNAVRLEPNQSFHHELMGQILYFGGAQELAENAFRTAADLNPSNLDALAGLGQAVALGRKLFEGTVIVERAIAAAEPPPPWYHITPAMAALVSGNFTRAIDRALQSTAASSFVASAMLVAAAANVDDQALVERYRADLAANPTVNQHGVIPMMAVFVRSDEVLEVISAGLERAGLDPRLIWGRSAVQDTETEGQSSNG